MRTTEHIALYTLDEFIQVYSFFCYKLSSPLSPAVNCSLVNHLYAYNNYHFVSSIIIVKFDAYLL